MAAGRGSSVWRAWWMWRASLFAVEGGHLQRLKPLLLCYPVSTKPFTVAIELAEWWYCDTYQKKLILVNAIGRLTLLEAEFSFV